MVTPEPSFVRCALHYFNTVHDSKFYGDDMSVSFYRQLLCINK